MFQEDASGWQIFSYGKLGEVTENIRTFALPFESQPYTFKMKYKYDSFNRMQTITYPDNEVVNYGYNSGGMLDSIVGRKGSYLYPYVNHIAYNRFELKDSVLYGNGSITTYLYDTLMRLQHLFSADALGDTLQNIDYNYDAVSNITDIYNNSSVLANGLGGSYEGHYTYDNLYRLIRSDGNWGGTPNTSYSLAMRYHRNGRIAGKKLSATTVKNNAYGNTIHTDWKYNYADGSNKLLEIRDAIQPWAQFFEWDGNGNMSMHKNISEGCIRWYCWDEENRMQGAADCNNASIYQYDANGDRTYKFTGRSVQQGENGGLHNYATLYDPTLYASSYVVCTPRGYTKHYYAESERVASKIGNGCLKSLRNTVNVSANYNKKDVETNPYLRNQESLQEILSEKTQRGIEHFKQIMECLGLSCKVHENALETLSEFEPCNDEIEKECYWYHPDHLGSSSWITFSDGSAVQHLHYLPWGEDFVDQRSTSWNAMHTFSSKERDTETGLSYFGARYYSSDLSIWLSVDPMADKYPSLSPYTYCKNNPVVIFDPDGEDAVYIAFPDYEITAGKKKYKHLGHAGVLLIDNKTGLTKYYEYGRYDKEGKGMVRKTTISNVEIGKDGKPTQESLNKVLKQISNKAGHGGRIEGAYVESDKFKEMDEYAKQRLDENRDPKRRSYNIFFNNCGTFTDDVIKQDPEVKKKAPMILDPRPVSIIKEYQKKFTIITYDPVKD